MASTPRIVSVPRKPPTCPPARVSLEKEKGKTSTEKLGGTCKRSRQQKMKIISTRRQPDSYAKKRKRYKSNAVPASPRLLELPSPVLLVRRNHGASSVPASQYCDANGLTPTAHKIVGTPSPSPPASPSGIPQMLCADVESLPSQHHE